VRERVKAIVGRVLELDPDELPDDARNEDLPGWDSLRQLELMLALEAEFEIRIPARAMLELTSLPAIEAFVGRS
jgi:acyl carrier protein